MTYLDWYKKGIEYFKDRLFDEAIMAFEKTLELNPDFTIQKHSYFCIGEVYRQSKQLSKALEIFVDLIKEDDDNDDVWNGLGLIYIETGDPSKALYCWNRAVQLENFMCNNLREDLIVQGVGPLAPAFTNEIKAEKGKKRQELEPGHDQEVDVSWDITTPQSSRTPPALESPRTPTGASRLKNQLLGMFKAMKKLDVNQATNTVRLTRAEIESIMFELIGEGSISATYDNGVFYSEEVSRNVPPAPHRPLEGSPLLSPSLKPIQDKPRIIQLEHEPYSIAISPDGKYLAHNSQHKIVLREFPSGKERLDLEGHRKQSIPVVTPIMFHPNSKELISSGDGTTRRWNLSGYGNVLFKKNGYGLVFSPRGDEILCCIKNDVTIWSYPQGTLLKRFSGHVDSVYRVAYTPDYEKIVSCSHDRTVRIWDRNSGRLLNTLKGNTLPVDSIVVTPDGRHVISGSRDKSIIVWDIESGRELKTFLTRGWVGYLKIIPNTNLLAYNGFQNEVAIMDVEKEKIVKIITNWDDRIERIDVSPDGRFLVGASSNNFIKIWYL
ncbi:MAG: hypothetical protein ACFFCS_01800 [Candidatus Hodarchaeota archaeon]